ncbi:MAG TPA: hypothetical protein VG982_02120 [Candidatus Paceibacterota bacterium]|jgi:hypothetical protein|nr:hypothetical protein [Candidatus Paceibacterota bacterium]
MSLFKKILADIQESIQGEETKKLRITSIISDVSGVSVSTDQLIIKKGVVYLTIPPTIKMAVLLKKELIIKKCNEQSLSIGAIN